MKSSYFNNNFKSVPQEPLGPAPTNNGILANLNQFFTDKVSKQAFDFAAYDPSIDFLKKFTGKNVLITGATGGIGSQVVKKLLSGFNLENKK
jgi:3-oxoacyl-ACP reductase-like protein